VVAIITSTPSIVLQPFANEIRWQHCIAQVSIKTSNKRSKVGANTADLDSVDNKSILIVEDDAMNVQLVQALLSGEGYDLRFAFNADEALNALAYFKPGLILMDIQLPGKSGLELTRQLRTNPELNGASISTVRLLRGLACRRLEQAAWTLLTRPALPDS